MAQGSPGWRNWGDHPLVVLIAILSGVITIVAFVGNSNGPRSTNTQTMSSSSPPGNTSVVISTPVQPVKETSSSPSSTPHNNQGAVDNNETPANGIEPGLYRLTNRFLGEGRSLETYEGDSRLGMGLTGDNNRRQIWHISLNNNGWYRLVNDSASARALDTYSDGENQLFAGSVGNYSGQYWRIEYIDEGWYRLTNQYLGRERSLDTYGDSENRPFMGKSGNYSGQYWKLTRLPNGP